MEYTKEEAERAIKFVRHINAHFANLEHPDWVILCKICGKTIDEIGKERGKKDTEGSQ